MVEVEEFGDIAQKNGSVAGLVSSRAVRLDYRAFTSVCTRDEAEYLLMLDHTKGEHEREWRAFFVESMVEYLVWQRQPWGSMAEAEIDWFLGLVGDAPSPSLPALLYALVREMNDPPERLIALAFKCADGRLLG